jgi:prepilin-type N-terminal cleavage/methylation domain-containing protein
VKRARRGEAGFTLIEMMIAVTLFAVVIGVALQIAIVVTQGFETTREAQEAERGARGSLEYMSDVVRASSTGSPNGDAKDAVGCTGAAGIPVSALSVENHSDQPDKLTVIYALPGALTSLRSAFTSGSGNFDVLDSTGLTAGDSVIVSDGATARLVKAVTISAPSGLATIGTIAPASACPAVTFPNYSVGALVVRARVARFYVANASDGTPMLWMDPDGDGPAPGEPLAEGVEDMQIAVGIDLNGDGVITDNGNTTDEWFYNAPGDPAPPDPSVTPWTALRITLVSRTIHDTGVATQSARPALEDRPAGTADIHRRRLMSSVIEIRNLEVNP